MMLLNAQLGVGGTHILALDSIGPPRDRIGGRSLARLQNGHIDSPEERRQSLWTKAGFRPQSRRYIVRVEASRLRGKLREYYGDAKGLIFPNSPRRRKQPHRLRPFQP